MFIDSISELSISVLSFFAGIGVREVIFRVQRRKEITSRDGVKE